MFVSRARLVRWRRLAHGHDGLHGEARSAESGDSLRTLEGGSTTTASCQLLFGAGRGEGKEALEEKEGRKREREGGERGGKRMAEHAIRKTTCNK